MVKDPSSVLTFPSSSLNSLLASTPPRTTGGRATESASAREVSDTETSGNSTSSAANRNRGRIESGMSSAASKDDGAALAASKASDPSKAGGSDDDHDDDDEGKASGKGATGKSRRELPAGAVATLKAWLLSPEHFTHPYPTPQDQVMLMQKTGIDKKQLKNWFTNARRRIWKPMLKKQLEQGKLAATGAGGGGVAVPGVVPGLMTVPPGAIAPPGPSPQAVPGAEGDAAQIAIQAHYQQALQQPTGYDAYGNPTYAQQQQQPQQASHPGAPATAPQPGQYAQQYYASQQFGDQQQSAAAPAPIASSNSIGSLPPMGSSAPAPGAAGTVPPPAGQAAPTPAPSAGGQMNKTDSHAVLMELFARDQDLVRQATEGARIKAAQAAAQVASSSEGGDATRAQQQAQQQIGSQHPMKLQGKLVGSVPSINSWPHFSSVSSLNNLGTMTGVKSITNMSGADLASQGNLNKKGNLAAVKSIESMGRADSYAFLEIFFDDKSGSSGAMGSTSQRGVKRERDEDNDVGLSLDADESPSGGSVKTTEMSSSSNVASSAPAAGAPSPAPLPADGKDKEGVADSGTLKRAYDDALAARGLLSVSRSSEKLTDLALPAKMQRTLSQEYMRQQMQSASTQGQQFGNYTYSGTPGTSGQNQPQTHGFQQQQQQQQQGASQQYPGQHPGQQQQSGASATQPQQFQAPAPANSSTPLSDPSMTSASVEVPSTTKCALCHCINVDTQLRPCGHMFHGRCLKPSLTQNSMGPPKCPLDHIPMQSAVLAVPTDENASNQTQQLAPQQPKQQQQQQQHTWGSSGSLPSFQTHRPGPSISAEKSGGKA